MAALRLAGAAALLVLGGCTYAPNPQRIDYLNGFVGRTAPELVSELGPPQRTYQSGGHTFLAYDVNNNVYMSFGYGFGSWSPPYGMPTTPPEILARGCETSFELADGRVLGWNQRGTQCY